MNQIKIGAFISERRKAKGWTQSQLAEKLEITIRQFQNGKPDVLCRIYLCFYHYVLFWKSL